MTGTYLFSFFLGFCVLLATDASLHAQPAAGDSSGFLPTVQIIESAHRQSTTGSISQSWNTEVIEKSPGMHLADFIQRQTGTYMKSYGQGSLATSSMRGGSAGHTLILWNGLPIQSPMLGQLDLSLLPVQAAESVHLTPGGHAAMWGSGAISGVIGLNNEADFSNRLQLKSATELGSFGQFRQGLKLAVGGQKWQSVTRFSHQHAQNDFLYRPADGLPKRRQNNADLSQQYLGQDLYWKINEKNHLDLHLWWQQSARQIPPTNVQNHSRAHQDDRSTRLILEYKNISEQVVWNVKTGFFDEDLNYFDDLILLESRSDFQTFLTEISGQWKSKNNQFLFGNFNSFTQAHSEGYRESIPKEYRNALFASWSHERKKWKTQLSFRQEFIDGNWIPFAPTLGFDWNFISSYVLKGKVSRNYRTPTLNDRFWLPGGNPDLLPESGWSQELTLAHNPTKRRITFCASLTGFHRRIHNWILWIPQTNQAYWSAHNIAEVWSKGLESRASLEIQGGQGVFKLHGGYDYTRSTYERSLTGIQIHAGDQLLYTPIHRAFVNFSVAWKSFDFSYHHQFTGAAEGINDPVESFHSASSRFQYTGKTKRLKTSLFIQINNVWNANYLIVERRPMPGINFLTGVQLFFNQNQK